MNSLTDCRRTDKSVSTQSVDLEKGGDTTIDDPHIVHLLVAALLAQPDREYMCWEDIIQHPAFFPFCIEHVTQADMAACGHLLLERMGDD